jgi:hypothetical protein
VEAGSGVRVRVACPVLSNDAPGVVLATPGAGEGLAMLLYDRVIEWCFRDMRKVGLDKTSPQDGRRVTMLLKTPVFELSDVMALEPDWQTERRRAIPKRSPYQSVWCEWKCLEQGATGQTHWTIASWLYELSAEQVERTLSKFTFKHHGGGRTTSEFFSLGGHYYQSQMFRCIGKQFDENGTPKMKEWWNTPTIDIGLHYVRVKEDGSEVNCHWTVPSKPKGGFMRDLALCGMPGIASFYDDPTFEVQYPWPPFFAFGLLNCRNVVTETSTPDEATQRRVLKAGNPPRCVYKTLKIEVPRVCHDRQKLLAGAGDDGPKVRFHLCRGHFKNLQHGRFKTKGWHWWPAHWRGSRDVGEVRKTYELKGPPSP